jgi:hypothetical protein
VGLFPPALPPRPAGIVRDIYAVKLMLCPPGHSDYMWYSERGNSLAGASNPSHSRSRPGSIYACVVPWAWYQPCQLTSPRKAPAASNWHFSRYALAATHTHRPRW